MLDKGLRYDFIYRHSRNCSAEQLYKNYLHYCEAFKAGDKLESVGCYADALWYLKKFVGRNDPKKVLKIVSKIENTTFNRLDIESCYIYLVNKVARIHEFIDDYETAVLWAKKAIDLTEYFRKTNNTLSKDFFWHDDECYQNSKELYQKYRKYFDNAMYQEFIFDWEKEFYYPTKYANQNFKYRIHI